MVTDEARSSKLRVLMVVEDDTATSQIVEGVLRRCERLGVSYTKTLAAAVSFSHFGPDVVPFFVRCGLPALDVWIKFLRRAGHPYLYYIDDNFWELAGKSTVAMYYRQPSVQRSLQLAIANAYQVLTNSTVLAGYLQRFTRHTAVVPAFFDFSLIDDCVPEQTEEVRIGFAGSPSRAPDLELIRPIIPQVLQQIPRAIFEFCGTLPEGVRPSPRIRFFEHTLSYANFIRFQVSRNWAIGLAPLIDNSANRAKTNNKYREYGACAIAGIYSDIPPYHDSVLPGQTGLLAGPSPDSWLAAILQLANEPEQRRFIASNACRDVRERFSVDRAADAWMEHFLAVHRELGRRPSKLTMAYVAGAGQLLFARHIRQIWLEVLDTFRLGGLPLVFSKARMRLRLALIRRTSRRSGH